MKPKLTLSLYLSLGLSTALWLGQLTNIHVTAPAIAYGQTRPFYEGKTILWCGYDLRLSTGRPLC